MRPTLLAVLCAFLCAGPTAVLAQDEDDWEFQEDTARGIAVAAARYDAGQVIVVQCRVGALTVVLTGLPQSAEPLTLNASRADGRQVVQGWLPAGVPGAYRSASPGRDVRFLRGGGLYSVRTAEGETTTFRGAFDLPALSANLDRVLTACGWATSDDRDLLPDAVEVTPVNPREGGGRARMPTRRGATTRAPRQQIEIPPPPTAPTPAELGVSCIVRDMHLRDCRADHPASADNRDVRLTITTNEGREVYPVEGADPAASDGKRVNLSGRRFTVVDYIATVPAG